MIIGMAQVLMVYFGNKPRLFRGGPKVIFVVITETETNIGLFTCRYLVCFHVIMLPSQSASVRFNVIVVIPNLLCRRHKTGSDHAHRDSGVHAVTSNSSNKMAVIQIKTGETSPLYNEGPCNKSRQ